MSLFSFSFSSGQKTNICQYWSRYDTIRYDRRD